MGHKDRVSWNPEVIFWYKNWKIGVFWDTCGQVEWENEIEIEWGSGARLNIDQAADVVRCLPFRKNFQGLEKLFACKILKGVKRVWKQCMVIFYFLTVKGQSWRMINTRLMVQESQVNGPKPVWTGWPRIARRFGRLFLASVWTNGSASISVDLFKGWVKTRKRSKGKIRGFGMRARISLSEERLRQGIKTRGKWEIKI